MRVSVDLDGVEHVAYTSGLRAGLAMTLADLDDTDLATTARAGYAAVPEERVPEGARVVEHRLAAEEGVAILDVRLPPGLVPLRHAGDRPRTVGVRLAAVRIGLVRTLLDHALVAPCRFTLSEVADVLAALESLRGQLSWRLSRAEVVAVHMRLTRLDGQVVSLFGADGYRAGHPARALFVAQLVADTWVGS
jgi:hypothetical protein